MDQIKIKGKVNTAICYARVVEEEAIEQIRRMCDYPMTEGSRIRIMPDVHAGKGCTIGTTMTIRDKAVPNVVGVDIGCGMYTVNLGRAELDFAKIDEAAHVIPSGMNVWEGRQERFDLMTLACSRELKDTKRLERSLGSGRKKASARWAAATILSRSMKPPTAQNISSSIPARGISENRWQSITRIWQCGWTAVMTSTWKNARSSYAPTKSRAAERKSRRR